MKYDNLLHALRKSLAEAGKDIIIENCYECSGNGVGFFVNGKISAKDLAYFINTNFFSGDEVAKINEMLGSIVLDKKSTDILTSHFKLNISDDTNTLGKAQFHATNNHSSSSSSGVIAPTKTFIAPKQTPAQELIIRLGDPVISSKKQILLYDHNPIGYLGYDFMSSKLLGVYPVILQEKYKNLGLESFFLRLFEEQSSREGFQIYLHDAPSSGIATLASHIENTSLALGSQVPWGASQKIFCNNNDIGYISYTDAEEDGIISRRIDYIEINSTMRGRGLGTEAMKKFMIQSTNEGITNLYLFPVSEAKGLYSRLGFTIAPGSCDMKIHLATSYVNNNTNINKF